MTFSGWMATVAVVGVIVALLSGLHWKALDLLLDGFGRGPGDDPESEPAEPVTIARR